MRRVVAALLLAGCGPAARGEPAAPPVRPDSPLAVRGERVFNANCYPCHPGGEAGLGPALNDKPLPKGLVVQQIRRGLGKMPAFDEAQLSDLDVDAAAEWVLVLRRGPR